MEVEFPIPDWQDPETLTEMVSRILLLYGSELGLDRSERDVRSTCDSPEQASREKAIED
jgi:hypothetical protein